MNLQGRSFLKLLDFTPAEIGALLDLAAALKQQKKAGVPHQLCAGKNVALLFEKPSTRTRCAFEVAAADLGMHPVYLDPAGSQMGKKESMADTARVLGRMFDGIEYRGFGQERVETLAKYAGVPVWNGLTDEAHPTQILADFLTLKEHFGRLGGLKLVYLGDARFNMGNSLLVGCAKMGLDFTVCAPAAYQPDPALIKTCLAIAEKTGARLSFSDDPAAAVVGADALYTDVWVSMGEPEELLQKAGEGCVFLHCLPAFHDLNTEMGRRVCEQYGLTCMEVTDAVFEGPQSLVFDEAENRLHTIKAVMAATLCAAQ